MKGWDFMNTLVPELNTHNIILKVGEIQPIYPDEQVLFLCKHGKIDSIPLDIILAQYKYCLIHKDPRLQVYREVLREICPGSLKEMEGLYANK